MSGVQRASNICAAGYAALVLLMIVAQPTGVARGAGLMALVTLAAAGYLMADERGERFAAGVALLVMLLFLAGALLGPAPARAEIAQTYRSRPVEYQHDWHRHRHTRKVWRQHRHDDDRCKPRLAIVGDQYVSEKGAQEEADKAWMQTARWQWGERYMARENADDATYECGRSSVGSAVGQVFYRCRLTARPCRAEVTEGSR